MGNCYIFRAYYVVSLLFCLTTFQLLAQTVSIPQAPTGNADAMTIFGQYPQISYTGVPNINIPIYNFTYEGLSLPIVLSYNNNLVKPYNPGSWVGLGWNLSVGGVINRTVYGKPDDANWYDWADHTRVTDTLMGYYYNHSYLSPTNWYDPLRIHHAFTDLYKILNYTGDEEVNSCTVRDYAPDEFDFSIGDLSGSFYLDDQGNWKVRSKNKVKVVTNFGTYYRYPPTDNQTKLAGITLIDDRGISYFFGGAGPVEDVKSDIRDTLDRFIKTWYINRISFPNGKYILFHYMQGPEVEYSQPGYFDGTKLVNTTQKNHPIYLSSIESDLVDISFITSQRPSQYSELDTLKIESVTGISTQKFAFSYTPTKTNSFKLAGITQLGKDNLTGAHYGFQYNAESFDSLSVHPNTDHWGYYNTKAITANFYTSKARDTAHCRAELLERVTYPTGGYSTYTWEPNEATLFTNRYNDLQEIAERSTYSTYHPGGARIRQITNYGNTNTKISSKHYVYEKNFSPTDTLHVSSGIVHAIPAGTNLSVLTYEIGAESHVTYSEVAEVNNDGSYTVTKYSNSDNGYKNGDYARYEHVSSMDELENVTFPTYSSKAHERGFPLNVKTYSGLDTLLYEKSYQYNEDTISYVKSILLTAEQPSYNYFYVDYPYEPDGWYGSAIKIYTNVLLPTTVTEKNYNRTGYPVTRTTTYTYDGNTANLIKTQLSSNSRGQSEETDYLYPPDMVSTSQDPSGVYAAMTAANYTSPLIKKVKKVGSAQIVLFKTDFKSHTAGYNTFFKPDSSTVQYGTNAARTTDKYSAYDNNGHLVTSLKNGIIPTTYLYDNTGNMLIASFVNATKNEVMFEGFENPLSYTYPGTGGLAHSGSYYHLERGSGVAPYYASFVIPDGRSYVVSFWYHISGDKWLYKKEPYTGGRTLLPPGANAIDDVCIYPADAQVTTYSYNPLAGITSKTDTKGLTAYYEYDDLQRLVNIRDQDGNIKTHYCYNYAGQETDCTVPFVLPLSPPPDPPPPPYSPYGVYARLEISDVANEIYGSGDEASIYQTGNVCVKIYSDPACTIPLTLDHDLTIGLTFTTNQVDDGSVTNTDSENDVYTIPTGQNSYCLGTMDLDDFVSFLDEDNNFHYEEFIYGYTMTTSPYYAVTPIVYP